MEMMSSARRQGLPAPVSRNVLSFDGASIHYDLYPAGARTGILVVPGFWRERRHPSIVQLAALLHARQYPTAVCDLRGHGESSGTFGFNLNEHHDIAAIVRDMMARDGLDSVALVGLSYGAAISISTAARHQLPINALVLISPVADFGMLAPRINPFTIHRHIALRLAFRLPRFPWRLRNSPKLRAIDDIGDVHVPVCFIHVRNDWLVGHAHSAALYDRAHEPKELHIMDIKGNYHADRIFSVAESAVEKVIVEFLERHARP